MVPSSSLQSLDRYRLIYESKAAFHMIKTLPWCGGNTKLSCSFTARDSNNQRDDASSLAQGSQGLCTVKHTGGAKYSFNTPHGPFIIFSSFRDIRALDFETRKHYGHKNNRLLNS